MTHEQAPLKAVLFDFGGVLAEEGFQEGICAIARSQGLDPAQVHQAGMEAVYDTGYVLGRGSEADFWREMRQRTGIVGDDKTLSREILDRFVLRPGMLAAVRALRQRGITVAILSDQTDWLDWLDRRDGFFAAFDQLFNSYHLGKGKRDPSAFDDAVRALGVAPHEALLVDDMPGNVARAAARGLRTILFRDEAGFLAELAKMTAEDGLSIGNLSREVGMEPQSGAAAAAEFERAQHALAEGDAVAALGHLEKALKLHDNPRWYSCLGYCVAKERGQFLRGVELCLTSLEQEPANPVHYLNLGNVHLVTGNKDEALRVFREGMAHGGDARLLRKLNELGMRKPPVLSFLPRDNLLNRYLGLLFSRVGLR
jgi:HAD superfamily hydrolase (TIGR01509 family)